MAKRRIFDFSTAYAQLILLVFLPICALAIVGAVLVFRDTSDAARIKQKATADTAISRYESVVYSVKNSLVQLQNSLNYPQKSAKSEVKPQKPTLSFQERQALQANLETILQNVPQDRHVLGMALVDETGQMVVSTGNVVLDENFTKTWQIPNLASRLLLGEKMVSSPSDNRPMSEVATSPSDFGGLLASFSDTNSTQLLSPIASQDGSLYGKKIPLDSSYPQVNPYPQASTDSDLTNDKPSSALWLMVNIDDEPLQLARLQVMFALAITGLLTILLLLLSLNIYARKWIAPIYEMRLHLQRTSTSNLYKPMSFTSSGEINQLQQDLTKTLRRLHTSFQELKNHAEQTEDDLRLAFDEMEMQNISIRNARDAAVSASQLKSAFLANISHELRTPLNSIDGFINLLARHGGEKGGLSAEQNLYVQTIRKSSAHLLALVNDVLDFSKIEAGKLVLDSHEFDLYASIYDVVDMLSPLAAEKQLNLAVVFYDDVPRHLVGDALRVKQVLTNLVNNAIKFTDIGEVVVRVSLDEHQDNFLVISVQDTGKGVPAQQQAVLFQSFSQGDPSITRQYGGTGLGLVISKQLTQLMGGQIGYEASFTEAPFSNQNNSDETKSIETGTIEEKHGSIFWFSLPIHLPLSLSNPSPNSNLCAWEVPDLAYFKAKDNRADTFTKNAPQEKMPILVWLEHIASLYVLKGSLNHLPVAVTAVQSQDEFLENLIQKGNGWGWVIVDNSRSSGNGSNGSGNFNANLKHNDINARLKQIRLHYAGRLALFGYQINLDNELMTRYQAQPLYQPLDRRQLYQLLADNDSRHNPTKALPQWQGYRILAVDDHPPNLLVLEALLAELGIAVVTASSGYEAIDYMRQYYADTDIAIDLIFMDIQMPKMSGQEAATQIRQLEKDHAERGKLTHYAKIPIIALTAHSLSDEKESLLASGIDDYVGKPISQAQLLQILQKWLGKHSHHISQPTSQTTYPMHLSSAHQNPTQATQIQPQPKYPTNLLMSVDLPTGLPVIDWDDALMRAAGKADLASNLMMMLIDSIDQEKADLEQAWQAHDRQALANIAHRILGASRYTGVPSLRQASQNFEDKCLLSVHNQSPAQFALLRPTYQQLMEALDTLKHTDLTPWSQLYYYRLKEQDMPWKMM